MKETNFRDQFTDIADACALAQSIVDTVREPVLVLDQRLRVIAASRSFYSSFKVRPEDTQADFSMRWATDSGTFPNFAYCWNKSYLSTASWKIMRLSTSSPALDTARCT